MAETPESPERAGPGGQAAKPVDPATIATHSALEFLLTFTLLFCVVTITRWVMGPSDISDAVPQVRLRLLIIGVCVGLLLAGLILSKPGKISGSHTNPAISLAMWRFGVFPGRSVVPYVVAQLAGSVLGVIAARAVWGPVIEDPRVKYAVLQPGPGWSAGELFVGEAVSMGFIVYLVGIFLQSARLAPLVPWLVGLMIGAAIVALGTATGGSVNPARQFGPAVASGRLAFLWVYVLAPLVGAAISAAVLNRVHQRREVLTHRLCGTRPDGSPIMSRPRTRSGHPRR